MITTSEVGVSVTIDNERYIKEIEKELAMFGGVTVDHDMVMRLRRGRPRMAEPWF